MKRLLRSLLSGWDRLTDWAVMAGLVTFGTLVALIFTVGVLFACLVIGCRDRLDVWLVG